MFARTSKVIIFAFLTFALLAVANPVKRNNPTVTVTVTAPGTTSTVSTGGQCNTGPIQCCNSVQSASSSGVGLLLGLLGVVLGDLNVLVGLTCSPISVIGVGGNSCTAQPVCCENNNFNGIIAIGCTPININL